VELFQGLEREVGKGGCEEGGGEVEDAEGPQALHVIETLVRFDRIGGHESAIQLQAAGKEVLEGRGGRVSEGGRRGGEAGLGTGIGPVASGRNGKGSKGWSERT